jgi:hypothetical protein
MVGRPRREAKTYASPTSGGPKCQKVHSQVAVSGLDPSSRPPVITPGKLASCSATMAAVYSVPAAASRRDSERPRRNCSNSTQAERV